jgi:cytochrome c553
MNECAACHSRTAPAHAPVSQWAVTGNFKHQSHAMDPRSNKMTSCVECHGSIATAKDLTTAVLPAMAQCEGCHDGKKIANGKPIFKTTGFDCARCHLKNDKPGDKPAPVADLEHVIP